ncbi:Uu.00g015460.m01.CDS01 [Anthostomella pinea]|uniref:Uu.00g015460.m01.CDS01 n=1 Tax=Anthostomella pinea TaxID=933095 RepID=A0AAI8YN68_9PEZI|nr:Uu.00g015460.m01.CDS01 [Anthostomella pinea]
MGSSRKRTRRDTETDIAIADTPKPSGELPLLQRVRNSWQFANLFQWIYLFGKVVKVDENLDIDDLEAECLNPHSTALRDIGLALLKSVSSHRGLTPELFDEYTRRQYVAKAPARNPFGTDETPARFDDFDATMKIKVLQQLTQWVMLHPERVREKMDEQKPSDQTEWRIEPTGWDSDDRTYYILDDNRLYRMTAAPPTPITPWKPKKNTKKAKAAARAAKRRRVSRSTAHNNNDDDDDDDDAASDTEEAPEPEDDGLGGAKWECIGTTLEEIQDFIGTIRKTRDENEKILRGAVEEHLLPILEKQEESRKRKALQREKEMLSLEKMAHAKRSSRLAGKIEQQKQQEQAKEEEQRRRIEEAAARKEEQKRLKIEKERDHRMMSREQRLKERETKRLQHEEELAQLSEDSKNMSSGTGRLSERRLKVEMEKNKQALQELEEEEEDWIFDCICGVYGQVDDGTHSVACERCNIWQHSKCVGISEEDADREDFHFICKSCKQQQSSRPGGPKPTVIKLKVNQGNAASSASDRDKTDSPVQQQAEPEARSDIVVEIPSKTQGASELSQAHPNHVADNKSQFPPTIQPLGQSSIPIKPAGQATVLPPPSPYTNGDSAHPFSSPHPMLSPPEQSPNKSRAYSTLFNPSSPVPIGQHSKGEGRAPQKGVFHVSPRTNGSSQAPQSIVPPHADAYVPPVTATSESPLKQPFDATSSNLTVLSPSAASSVSFTASAQTPSSHNGQTNALSTPQIDQSGRRRVDVTPTLPPTRNGLSPLKRSPPPLEKASNGVHSSPTPSILPPSTALPPSPSQQILTPPVKSADPARPPSQQSSGLVQDA